MSGTTKEKNENILTLMVRDEGGRERERGGKREREVK